MDDSGQARGPCMPNKNDDSYGLTALFPIEDRVAGDTTEESLRAYLADLPCGCGSPFARTPSTNFTRFVVIDKQGFGGGPSVPDSPGSPCLLWRACFSGDRDPWLTATWKCAQREIQEIFSHCVDYDEYRGQEGFMRYVQRGQRATAFLFGDYPNATVEEVLDGLEVKKHFADFLVDNRLAGHVTLKGNFFDWMDEMVQ